jgi:hypothetical protein
MMRWMVSLPVFLVWWVGAATGWAALPLSQAVKLVDEEPEKAFPLLQKELARTDLSPSLRAQFLQLQKGRAKDTFRRALKIAPDVPLRGEMSPLMRQQFLLWRKEFLLHHAVRRRPPPPLRTAPNLVPSIVLLSFSVAAFAGAAILGAVALSEQEVGDKAYNQKNTDAAKHFRQAYGFSLGSNLAYATGGALLVASAIWLTVELTKPSAPPIHTPDTAKERILW